MDAELAEFATKLFDFARAGDLVLMDYIAQGVDVNLVNHNGDGFLMLAAYNGHAELCAQLVRAGANVNALNDRGQSPLAGVIFKKEDELVDILLAAGADPALGTPTALDTAAMFGRQDLVEKLRAAQAG